MARTRQENRKGPRQPLTHETTTPLPGPSPASKLPSVLRFPLVAIISLGTSLALRSVSSPFSEGDLSGVSTQRDDWIEIAGFLGWKIVDLAVAWFSDYDGKDFQVPLSKFVYADPSISLGHWFLDLPRSSALLLSPDIMLQHTPDYGPQLYHH